MIEPFLNGKVTLHAGDCLDVLARLDACSIDSVVTDPPYHLTSIVKRFGKSNLVRDPDTLQDWGRTSPYERAARGFMGKQWDGGDVAFRPETWRAVYRVLKPGGYLLAFGGERTQHRVACAIEEAGFEIRSTILWLFGQGFPKSHDVSKGIDRAAGAEREVLSSYTRQGRSAGIMGTPVEIERDITIAATDAARAWAGWGTALKPAAEFVCMARKPLSEGTVAANVLRWGTGAINIDGCRVAGLVNSAAGALAGYGGSSSGLYEKGNGRGDLRDGRWPANVIHDGSEEVVGAFPDAGGGYGVCGGDPAGNGIYGGGFPRGDNRTVGYGDSGSAARFFYSAKADADDRIGSKHPTVKPVDLMQYLVRLVTPRGGVVLDPFAGTGTTGEAAWREGMRAVLIEAEPEYQADIRRRMALALAGPDERVRESIKARGEQIDYGPLFAALREAAE